MFIYKFLNYLLIISLTLSLSQNIFLEENELIANYLNKLSKIISKSHHGGYIGVVINNGTNTADKVLKYLHQNISGKVAVLNVDDGNYIKDIQKMRANRIWMGYVKIVYIFTNSTLHIPNLMPTFKILPYHQTRSKIMIELKNSPTNKELINMFQYFWSLKYMNIVVTFLRHKKPEIYTFNPFWPDKNLENITNKDVNKIFYNKYEDINGYILKTMIFKDDDVSKLKIKKFPNGTKVYSGYEIDLLTTLAKKMNGNIHFITTSELLRPNERNPWRNTNDITKNESAIKIRIITEKEIDLMNSEELVLNEDFKGVTESLYPHSKDDMKIFMHKRGKIPHFRYLFMVFNSQVWTIFSFILVLGTICWTLSGSIMYKNWLEKFINILRMVTGGSLPLSKTKHSEKIFIILWLFYTLIIITAFTSKLASILMDVRYYKDYDTIDELYEAGLILYAWKTQIVELQKAFNGTSKYPFFQNMQMLPPQYDYVNNSQNKWKSLLFDFPHPFVVNSERATWIANMKGVHNLFHVVKESPIPNFMAFQVPAGSPLLGQMNNILRKIMESGLFQYWRGIQRHMEIITKVADPEIKTVEHILQSLTLDHLNAAFIILFTGILLSCIAFVSETVYFKMKYTTI